MTMIEFSRNRMLKCI